MRYEFVRRVDLQQGMWDQLRPLLQAYERDIGGIDLGIVGLFTSAEYVFTVHDGDDMAGFALGKSYVQKWFEGEKSFTGIAAYLDPKFRKSQNSGSTTLEDATDALFDTLKTQGFDRFAFFPYFGGMVTEVGREKVLRPLSERLNSRSGSGSIIGNTRSTYSYVFNFDEFKKKLSKK